jgi:hypothetical protein
MSEEGLVQFLGHLRAVPEPEHGQSEMQYFSRGPKLSLTLILPQIPPETQDPEKNLFEVAEVLEFSFLLNLLQADKGQQTTYKGKLSLLFLSLGVHLDTRHSPGFSWKSRLFMEISIVSRE